MPVLNSYDNEASRKEQKFLDSNQYSRLVSEETFYFLSFIFIQIAFQEWNHALWGDFRENFC